jgi:hypothetical protein
LWALIAVISFLILLIIVLSLPVDFIFSFNTQKSPHLKIYLKAFYGLFHINLLKRREKRSLKQQEKKAIRESGKEFDPNVIIRIINIKGLFHQTAGLIKDLLHSLKIRKVVLDLKIGLEDPVDNGYLFTCVTPVNYLLSRTRHNITIQTLFENELIFYCNLYASIRLFPILIAGSTLRFLFSRPAFGIIKIFTGGRWRRKR